MSKQFSFRPFSVASMVVFNRLPSRAINDDDRRQKNDAIQKCSDFPPQSCVFDFVNLPASGKGGLNCSTDEGRPLGVGLQEQIPNHLRRLCSKGKVVNTRKRPGIYRAR